MNSILFGYSGIVSNPGRALAYVAAAIIPAVILLRFIWNRDSWEKEPPELLRSLLLRSAISVAIAFILEWVFGYFMEACIDYMRISYEQGYYMKVCIIEAIMVGFVEEFAKDIVLFKRTWNDPAFDFRFDAIVYSAFVSLGFAAIENVKYVFSYGISVSLPRALLAIPGHLGFSVIFGYFYGRARHEANGGRDGLARTNLLIGYLLSVAAHAFYDACAMIGTSTSMGIFYVFVAVMYLFLYRLIKRESATNDYI